MANVIVPNYTLQATNNTFSAVWKLTRALKKAGWVYKASSDGSSNDITGVATVDKWGGAEDPITDSYPTLSAGAWWGAQGPSTIKVPIGASIPSGDGFFRGEKVTQAVSGAEGELMGVVTDASTSLGYLVLSPRTGTFDGTNIITGSGGATVTPTATPIEFIRNVVFWYYTTLRGHIYYQVIDSVGEASSNLFSAARLGAITNTICPGGASSGDNDFPTIGTFAVIGYGGSNGASSNSKYWTNAIPLANYGSAQIMVTNIETDTDTSADGTFTLAIGTPNGGTGSYIGFAFLRCDNQEDGDIDPFVWFAPNSSPAYTNNATTNTTLVSSTTRVLHSDFFGGGLTIACINYNGANQGIAFRGWRRRGLSSNDTFQEFAGASLCTENVTSSTGFTTTGNISILEESATYPEAAATMIGVQKITEPIWIVAFKNDLKMRKGTVRWWYFVQGGKANDMYNSKTYIQLSSTTRKPIIAGPWDGTSTPDNY